MKNKVLLIGGGGFIGKNLQVIKDDDVMVSVIDSLPPVDGLAKYPSNKIPYFNMPISIDSYEHLLYRINDADTILVLAGSLGVDNVSLNPMECFVNNTSIIQLVSKALSCTKSPKNAMFFSSSEVYGNMTMFRGMDAVVDSYNCPRSLYAMAKLYGEKIFKGLVEEGKINAGTVLRPFNITGAHQQKGVVAEMLRSGIVNKQIRVRENTTRTLTPVKDAVDALIALIKTPVSGYSVHNLVSEYMGFSLEVVAQGVAKFLKAETGADVGLKVCPMDSFIRDRVFNASKVEYYLLRDREYEKLYPLIKEVYSTLRV